MRSRTVRWPRGIKWGKRPDSFETEVQSETTPHVLRIGKDKDAAGRRRTIVPPDLPEEDAELELEDDGSDEGRDDEGSSE